MIEMKREGGIWFTRKINDAEWTPAKDLSEAMDRVCEALGMPHNGKFMVYKPAGMK